MITKGIRGAITVDENSVEAIKDAALELLNSMIAENLNAAFPAKFARLELGWTETAMMCFHELDVPGSLEKCLRVLIVLNCGESFKPKFVYLKGASILR